MGKLANKRYTHQLLSNDSNLKISAHDTVLSLKMTTFKRIGRKID